MDHAEPDPLRRFAGYVATLGRGPGKSRALTREEAADALGLVLADRVHPAQLGAFLMLLRYRGEDPEEITGLVQAARLAIPSCNGTASVGAVDLDWPSYGAGRTRVAPWFLLSALALAQSGRRVLMHGSNAFGGGMTVQQGLEALGLHASHDPAAVAEALERNGFAYWPAASMSPAIDRLLGMRSLFGLRSPINTVARLVDPGNAGVSVDGVFHPAYIALHLAIAERLGRRATVVIKGGGGEAERTPLKPVAAHLWRDGAAHELMLPPLGLRDAAPEPSDLASLWREPDETGSQAALTVVGTIALALLALGVADAASADEQAFAIWRNRRPLH